MVPEKNLHRDQSRFRMLGTADGFATTGAETEFDARSLGNDLPSLSQ
jgi:hypothetical protein